MPKFLCKPAEGRTETGSGIQNAKHPSGHTGFWLLPPFPSDMFYRGNLHTCLAAVSRGFRIGSKLDFFHTKQACTISWVDLATASFPPERFYRWICAYVLSLRRIVTLRSYAITDVISDRLLGAT